LRGERFDGHVFIPQAIAGGARALLVDVRAKADLGDTQVPYLVVPDTLVALGDLARYVRRQTGTPVVAVTGSNGKTTTKEMVASALATRGKVHKNRGNFNNLVGLPLTVLDWPDGAWAAVLEMGMSAPGEISRLTEIAEPNVGLITNVGPAHLERLGTLEAVARAKGELFAGLPRGATAVINDDDPLVREVCDALAGEHPRLRFGSGNRCDVRVVACRAESNGARVVLAIDGDTIEVILPVAGMHNAFNAAAAAAAAWALGIERDAMARGLAEVSIPAGRLRVAHLAASDLVVIDDTYNANPASMRAAFAVAAELAGGRRVAVLGDMLELGEQAAQLHHDVGEAAAAAGIVRVLALGTFAAELAEGARASGAEADSFTDFDELLAALDATLAAGDRVLVKGSRGMQMERVVAHLEGKRG
jgi:UDP-N-acetylmuramoyl-tripeptide--D-alanyl-D-alanine ligase